MAGTVAAIDNGNHLIGVAPRVDLYAIKVEYPLPDVAQVIDGIFWAVSKGVHIIFMSLGYRTNETNLKLVCDYAYSQGVLLIVASGNSADLVSYPARYESVVAVGAVDQNDNRWLWSNYGYPELEFAALGVDINSTFPPNAYQVWTGTSMATPHVTGAATLIFASKVDVEYDSNGNGRWENFEVREKLKDTALDLGPTGKDGYYGYGLVNAWHSNQRPQGDINYDLMVDMRDVAIICYYNGTMSEDPYWWYGRRADININNVMDMRDLAIAATHFGEVDP